MATQGDDVAAVDLAVKKLKPPMIHWSVDDVHKEDLHSDKLQPLEATGIRL